MFYDCREITVMAARELDWRLLRCCGSMMLVVATAMANLEGFVVRCSTTIDPPLQLRLAPDREFDRMLSKCSAHKTNFDQCIHGMLNELRIYFPTGESIVYFLKALLESKKCCCVSFNTQEWLNTTFCPSIRTMLTLWNCVGETKTE